MFMLQVLLKVFIILPIVALSSCAASGYISGGGDFNWFVAVITSVIASISYLVWDGKREKDTFTKHVASLGINLEYVACYGDGGIAIDKTNNKLFAGKINNGKIFEFNEISSIEWEDYPVGNHMKYMININTKNFDLPKLTVGFGGNRGIREQAYAKLRAALNID